MKTRINAPSRNAAALAIFFVFTGVIAGAGCSSTPKPQTTQPTSRLSVETHTAGEAGFLANSHLISGKRDAVLIDAQFTRSEAKEAAEMIRRSGKNLTTIFVTHGHPDHYLGLETLKKEFPKTKILATPATIKEIRATAPGKIKYWKTQYKADLADKAVIPTALTGGEILLEGESLQIVEMGPGESEASAVVYLPTMQALFTGDLAYNGVHLWLAENRPDAWIKNLEKAKTLGTIKAVYPGHGKSAGAELLDEDRKYIESYLSITQAATSQKQASDELKKQYDFALPIIAEMSVGARVKQ